MLTSVESGGTVVELLPGSEREIMRSIRHAVAQNLVDDQELFLVANLPITVPETEAGKVLAEQRPPKSGHQVGSDDDSLQVPEVITAAELVTDRKQVRKALRQWHEHLQNRIGDGGLGEIRAPATNEATDNSGGLPSVSDGNMFIDCVLVDMDVSLKGGFPSRTEVEQRLKTIFKWLDKRVSERKIGCFGVSSRAFLYPVEDPRRLELEAVLALLPSFPSPDSPEGGGEAPGRFRPFFIRTPFNLLHPNLMTEKNYTSSATGQPVSLFEFAREKQVAVFCHRPLDWFQPCMPFFLEFLHILPRLLSQD